VPSSYPDALKPGYVSEEEELIAFFRRHLASFKTPRVWRFVSEFQQTASGKIQKFVIREQLLAEFEHK
jgi:fatty-acyl-CoA synthase